MEKIFIDLKPGDKLTILEDKEVLKLSMFLQNENEIMDKKHVFIIIVRSDEHEKIARAFLEKTKLQGTAILVRMHANKQTFSQ
jgi:PDZ domain-containing secreted protein